MKYFLIAVVGVLLLLGACDIADPHMPAWDLGLTVPLLNERFLVSELADSVNIVVGEDDVLTITGTGEASTPDFGEVNFNPELVLDPVPLFSGIDIDTYIPLADPTGTVFLSYGHLEQGYIEHYLDLIDSPDIQVTLVLPDIKNAGGSPLTLTNTGGTGWVNTSLIDCTVGIHNSGDILDSLRVQLTIQSSLPDGTPVGTGGLRIDNQLGCDEFQGYLYNYIRAFDGSAAQLDIDYPHELDEAVQFQEATINLAITNEIGFAAEFHGQIHAINNSTGQERTIDILDDQGQFFDVQPASESGPGITELQFSNAVHELLQVMPDHVELVNGYLLINGGHDGTPGFVKETDRIFCTYQVDAPCRFILYDHTFTMSSPSKVEISEDIRDKIKDFVISAAMTMEVTNHVPIGASATCYVSQDSTIDIDNPATYAFSKQFTLRSSEYTGPDVNDQGEQLIQLQLNETELEVFTNPIAYILLSFSLEPSDGPVTIYASPADYIQVKGMLSAQLIVDVEEL
jgi:hypothetical protein